VSRIQIEPIRDEKVASLAPLFEAQLREHGISSSLDALTSVLRTVSEQSQHGFVLSATCDGTLVGVAYAARILSLEHGGWSGWLEELYVLPEWRGQGAGTELLAAVIVAATERGWKALDLEVDSNHQRVLRLYARHEFQAMSRSRFARVLR
jgi:GNAT superfamily N-acetyltransferase